MEYYRNVVFIIFLLVHVLPTNGQNPTNVLSWIKFDDANNSLVKYLSSEAIAIIDEFESGNQRFQNQESFQEYQSHIKETMWKVLGGEPAKTPLNARITKTISKEGYTLENIIFESLPGLYVTGTLFIPHETPRPAPAILFCSGHSTEAYRRKSYQLPLLNLVKKGFIVFAIDPIGQGERSQYFDEKKEKSDFDGRSTQEHSYPSVQSFLIGESVAKYFTWDGIRAIDYLCSRPEVDADRIGVHGLSGGGTQTAYISALDERVKASAPAGYITSYRRLIESIGVQDGEQNLYHGLKNEIDHLDFILARAPKPTLIMATTNDFFSIQGAYETFNRAKNVFGMLGHHDDLEFTEDEYGHGYTRKNREAMYLFFQTHLNHPGNPEELDVELLSFHDFQKTTTGQVATSLGGETVFSLIEQAAGPVLENLQQKRAITKDDNMELRQAVVELSGYKNPTDPHKPIYVGQQTHSNYMVRMHYMEGEGDYVFPFLEYLPPHPNGKSVVYLHPNGKNAVPMSELEYLIDRGFTIYVPDMVGVGEVGGGALKGDAYIGNVSYNVWYTAVLIGRSIVGIQASDVTKLARYIKSGNESGEVYGIASGQMAPTLLHIGALDSVFSRFLLIRPYASYAAFVQNKYYDPQFVFSLVPGALTGYDLGDLAALIAPRPLIVAGGITPTGYLYPMDSFAKDWSMAQKKYEREGYSDQIQFIDVNFFREDDHHDALERLIK